MQSEIYRRVFPLTRIGSEKNTETDFMTTQRGGRFATSTGGTLMGRGGDIFILDDVMNPEEAMSDTLRAKVVNWFQATLLSRLNDKRNSAIIVVMQRLHVDDLVGVLLKGDGWYHLDLPAIADQVEAVPLYSGGYHPRRVGDVLDAVREPLSELNTLKAGMGTMLFSALYLQRPIPAQGNLIRKEWLSYYEVLPSVSDSDLIVTSWDTAMKADELSDYSVGTTWLIKGETYYLLDLVRNRFELPSLKRAVLSTKAQYPRSTILVEDKGSGTSLIQLLRAENIRVIGIDPIQDKVTRLYAVGPMFESGAVKFPQRAPWLGDLIAELMAFPHAGHDDQVDSVSQFLAWAAKRKFVATQQTLSITEVYEDGSSHTVTG
jgi:predicted phage terminase large subunit-like protein